MGFGWAILAAVLAAFGGARTWAELRRMRTPPAPPDVLASLRQEPPSIWQQHPAAAVAIGLHLGAAQVLAATLLLDLALRGRGPTLFNLPALAFVAYIAGMLGAVPFAQRAIRPVRVHIAPWGIVESGGSFTWEQFGGCAIDDDRGIVRLSPPRHPWLPRVLWCVPDRAELARASELVVPHIPASPPGDAAGAGPAALVLAAAALALPLALGGVALALWGGPFLTGYIGIGTLVLLEAWNPIFTRFTD